MEYAFKNIFIDVTICLISLVLIVYLYFEWAYTYWSKKKVPFIKPQFPFGNDENPLKRQHPTGIIFKGFYDEFKRRGEKHGGVYVMSKPIYVPIAPELVKSIMAKDFQYFVDRGVYHNEKADPLSAHLFAIGGTKWRNLRTKLTPTFTSGKMKMMFSTLIECGQQLEEAMERHYRKGEPIDIKDVSGCYTTDVIGSCAFGLECNSFKDPKAPFRVYGKEIFQRTLWRSVKFTFTLSFPSLAEFLNVKAVPTDAAEFYMNVVKDTVDFRDKKNINRKDFLQLLMDLRNDAEGKENGHNHDGKSLTIEEMAAQSFVFFLAGFETSSTTMTYCLFELSRNQEIQEKVREEMNAVLKKHEGKITYDAIMEMKYLGQVIDETLRKYPPVPAITRQCVKDYKLPDDDITIEKDTKVFISVMGLQYDSEHHPDPEKFDPERFSDENKHKMTPFTYMPFGEGPRICIGMRFGLMQTKVGLTILLTKYKFTMNEKTKTPLTFDPSSAVLSTLGGIYLDATKI